jgi:hypothetical protein
LLPVDRTWANDPVLESATFTILLFCDGAEAGCETASHVAQQPCEHFFAEMDGSLFEPTTEMSSQEAFLDMYHKHAWVFSPASLHFLG